MMTRAFVSLLSLLSMSTAFGIDGNLLVKAYHLPLGYTQAYYARRIEPKLARPDYLAVKNPKVLYRGMYITPDDLNQILRRGMRLDLVRWNTAGEGISFSSNINEAASYIFQSADGRSNGIGVVFEVEKLSSMKLVNDAVLNSTRTIFKANHDIAPNVIRRVMIWGRYGLENLSDIEQKARDGRLIPHGDWTDEFQSSFSR